MHDNPQNRGKVLLVGDEVESRWGRATVTGITVALRPSTDPGGETDGAVVEGVELAYIPCVITLDNGHWLYGSEVTARYLPRERVGR